MGKKRKDSDDDKKKKKKDKDKKKKEKKKKDKKKPRLAMSLPRHGTRPLFSAAELVPFFEARFRQTGSATATTNGWRSCMRTGSDPGPRCEWTKSGKAGVPWPMDAHGMEGGDTCMELPSGLGFMLNSGYCSGFQLPEMVERGDFERSQIDGQAG
eukprot:Skav206115  [mRNA]  locus=scaffold172:21133:36072:+ [translate_table: standard]